MSNVTKSGRIIGNYKDHPIHDMLLSNGGKYLYDRIAILDTDGTINLSQLKDNEVVISPGLVYREV